VTRMDQRPPVVFFCYADPSGFSGQRIASEIVIQGLLARGWRCRRLPLPVKRAAGTNRWSAIVRYLAALLVAWVRSLAMVGTSGARLHLNLGQTRASFIRDIVPLVTGRLFLGRRNVAVSLHGSLFMRWSAGSLNSRVFVWMLKRAGVVTVLGERQRAHLQRLGVATDALHILPNTCGVPPLSADALRDKLQGRQRRVQILHLSTLYDTKGYPQLLEALDDLTPPADVQLDVILCGKVVVGDHSSRFPSVAAAARWIEERIDSINRNPALNVRWIKGAAGEEKNRLFNETHLFVLPTEYPVEAQPIVLIEAMASGCAIVTTRVGEIESILDSDTASFLTDTKPATIRSELGRLIADPVARAGLAGAAWRKYVATLAVDAHIDRWEHIFRRKA